MRAFDSKRTRAGRGPDGAGGGQQVTSQLGTDATLTVPYLDLDLPDRNLILRDFEEILRSSRLTKGPFVARYETALAERLQVPHVIAFSSCTTGLALLYR